LGYNWVFFGLARNHDAPSSLFGQFLSVAILGGVARHSELVSIHHVHGANQLAPRRLAGGATENAAVLFDHNHEALPRRVNALLRGLFELFSNWQFDAMQISGQYAQVFAYLKHNITTSLTHHLTQ